MVEEVPPNVMSNELCCHFSRTVVTARSINFNRSILNAACFIFQNASTSQWVPAVWTKVREKPEVIRDGYSRVARKLTTSISPVSFGCIVWQPVHLRRTGPTAWGSNGPPQQYYGRFYVLIHTQALCPHLHYPHQYKTCVLIHTSSASSST